jgi:diaminopimelate decarboxylase
VIRNQQFTLPLDVIGAPLRFASMSQSPLRLAGVSVEQPWWAHSHLHATEHCIRVGNHDVAAIAREHGTPVYVYSSARVRERLQSLRDALTGAGMPFHIYYAIKANRFGPLLELLGEEGVGVDVCSPRELDLALRSGFSPDRVSFNAGMLSNRDLDHVAKAGVHATLDALSGIRRYAARVLAGTRIGLRVNPGIEVGYGQAGKCAYGNSKFGLYRDAVEHGLEIAHAAGLIVDTLHIHCGWGIPASATPLVDGAFEALARLASRVHSVQTVNVGGGLGVRQRITDTPLPLEAWAASLRRHFGPLGVHIACEPGSFLIHDAGVLVAEVNTVERKGDTTWVGIDAGHNVNVYAAHYGIPQQIVLAERPLEPPSQNYAVAGNLNEANDVFARACYLPEVQEGDLIALLPAGAYGATMASDHCLRGWAREVMV